MNLGNFKPDLLHYLDISSRQALPRCPGAHITLRVPWQFVNGQICFYNPASVWPLHSVLALKVELDSVNQVASLPTEKLLSLQDLISS